MKLELIMPISAGLREDIAVYRDFIGQQYIVMLSVLSTIGAKHQHHTCGAPTQQLKRVNREIMGNEVLSHHPHSVLL